MIELKVLTQNFPCRTKDRLWYPEMKTAVQMMIRDGKSLKDIRDLSKAENIFNATSASRASEISAVLSRRLSSVNEHFLQFFDNQNMETQLQLGIVLIMLSDRTFLRFMDLVYREKLIRNDTKLQDSEYIAFFHDLQAEDAHAATWTDAGIKKVRDNYKAILKEAGITSGLGVQREILRPIITSKTKEFLREEGLEMIYKILAGER